MKTCDGCTGCSAPTHTVPFPHQRWWLVASLAVFALVLFVVLQVSAWLDSMTSARLVEAVAGWEPASLGEAVAKAVVDGLIGLVGIFVPYMIPLMLLLVALEQAGIMQRIAVVIDRGFHQIGLHGAVSVAFLTGLGCNVPAIAGIARLQEPRERMIASLLVTFVPCSARSAIILALAGKYLGPAGVIGIFAAAPVIIMLLGRFLFRRGPQLDATRIHRVPPYALPRLRPLLAETWERSRDVITIVAPLLILGSVALALLQQAGADRVINVALAPVTAWTLGLPIVLGVPLLFGVLRKELSLLMLFQALGTSEAGTVLDTIQLTTLLMFVTFYVPCVSTFAVMVRSLGTRQALRSVALSVAVALAVSGLARFAMLAVTQIMHQLA